MGKKLKYKGVSRFNSIICLNVVVMTLLGISYGHWSNALIVNGEVSIGRLSVEGIIDEIVSSPIRVEIVRLEQSTPGYYKGSANIIFSIENTGDVAALISLNKNVIGDLNKNSWIKFINGDTVISECLMPVESEKFNVSVVGEEGTIIFEMLWDVEEFLLGPGERATLTLEEWEFEVALNESLGQLEMETQVSLAYKDGTGTWYGDTSNSLYIRKHLSEFYDISTLEMMIPPLMPGADIPATMPSSEADVITEEEPAVDTPVTTPSSEADVITGEEPVVDTPVTLPSSEADVITGEEPVVDTPATLPSDQEEIITGEEPAADTPVILPSDTMLGEEVEGLISIE